MLDKKSDKAKTAQKPREDEVELENQFILRLPEDVARSVHEALETGNLKDRMTIKLENDLRYGEVRFDNTLLHAKVVDLPTILECLKTIDNKSFYKSADVCQMMICKEEADALDSEKESPNKGKKKDPNKVDKKYLWPHGITPPCKNIRKRRFRKTLKKKNVEAPEIEKEVKRLLRIDNDAVKVEYEIINEDTDKRVLEEQSSKEEGDDEFNDSQLNEGDKTNDSINKDINVESDGDDEDNGQRKDISGSAEEGAASGSQVPIDGVKEHDIFGEEVSSSSDDDDDSRMHRGDNSMMQEIDDISRLSASDSHMSGDSRSAASRRVAHSNTMGGGDTNSRDDFTSRFPTAHSSKFNDSSSNFFGSADFFDKINEGNETAGSSRQQMSFEQIKVKLSKLRDEHEELSHQRTLKAQEISSIRNPTLRQRMQETLDNLISQISKLEYEIDGLESIMEKDDD